MGPISRKLRGALGMAVMWGLGWAVVTSVVMSLALLVWGDPGFFWDTLSALSALAGFSGFVGGAVFSTVLGTVHRRRSLGELKPFRMALWGAGAGLLVPMAVVGAGVLAGVPLEPDVILGVALGMGGLGGATGGGMVKIAQAGGDSLEPPDRLPGLPE
jgi:hypothetical protein